MYMSYNWTVGETGTTDTGENMQTLRPGSRAQVLLAVRLRYPPPTAPANTLSLEVHLTAVFFAELGFTATKLLSMPTLHCECRWGPCS